MQKQKVAFIGAGSMAEAMISGLLKRNMYHPDEIFITNRNNIERLTELKNKYRVTTSTNKEEVVKEADIVVLAMKPKDVVDGIQAIKPYIHENQLFISVLAGISTERITNLLDAHVPVVRAMPNTSAAIGFSATGIAAGKYATEKHIDIVTSIFDCIGITTVTEEEELHAVTGLSGSGPAYIYYIVEAMEDAAKDLNMNEAAAKDLIAQTLLGAAHMLRMSKDNCQTLRRKVTSPGGTTEAGIQTLDAFNVREAFQACIKRAAERSMELGKLNAE